MNDLIEMGNFSTSQGIQWTPPGASANSGNSTLTTQGTENAQSVGKLDIPPGTTISTVFPIPFGTVDAAKVCVVQNQMSSEVGVRLNGHVTDDFTLGPGQRFCIDGATAGSTTPLTSVDIVTTVDPATTEQINYWVFGD